ncbi:mitogen-activated protein kinase kinase kinase 17-like [Benincasa hispida]|uniref:mitogen-activated protein kinase kinase kinase 17-like n=1 Tax=Benincasa hispida TaxID=102211 RepID=UPI001901CBE8|nr:mitogen-activated protein kinase kinase kinase 17-like [Benincasa hispida]
MENWVLVKIIGRGSYGVVCLAKQMTKEKSDRHYYFAVKLTSLQRKSSLLWEEQVLKHFKDCPEIVQCLGSEITFGDIPDDMVLYNLKLEYAPGGTLADLIKQRKKLPEDEVKDYLRMILKGLSCIHRRGFVHVDLKPANVLVFPQSDGKMKLKIADFGLAERCKHIVDDQDRGYLRKFKGTPKYMSPESIFFNEVNGTHDIWSLGCILVKMVSGKSVWDDCRGSEQLMTRLLNDKNIPTIPKELSKQGKDFIKRCFIRNYKQRWTADMLLQHPYLNEENEATKKGDDIVKLIKAIRLPHQFFKRKAKSSNNEKSNRQKEDYLPHLLYKNKSNK